MFNSSRGSARHLVDELISIIQSALRISFLISGDVESLKELSKSGKKKLTGIS